MQQKRRPAQTFYCVIMILLLFAGIMLSADACETPGSNNNVCGIAVVNNCNQNSNGH
jgi:hypothetical protein